MLVPSRIIHSRSTAYQQSLAYAQCMRAHGEPGYPDPASNGGFIIDGKKDHLNGS
jgi:hypothetical protein